MVSINHPSADIDDGWQLEVGTTVTFLCAFIVVTIRTFARFKYARIGWDDWIMLFALVQAVVATVFDFIAVNWGLGRHSVFLTKEQLVKQEYWSLLAQVFCVNALTFAKISICLSYLRVLRGSQNKMLKWMLYITAFLVFAVNSVVIISFYAECNPPAKSWDPFLPGSCLPVTTELGLVLLQGAFSALTDFFLAIFPFALFKHLHISKRNRSILLTLMGLGVVTGVFALIRTVESSTALHAPPGATPDTSFTSILGLLWAGMERNIAIMIASVPAIRPLASPFARIVSQTFSSSRRKATEQTGSYEMGRSNKFRKIPISDTSAPVPSKPSSEATHLSSNFPHGAMGGTAGHNLSEERILPMMSYE